MSGARVSVASSLVEESRRLENDRVEETEENEDKNKDKDDGLVLLQEGVYKNIALLNTRVTKLLVPFMLLKTTNTRTKKEILLFTSIDL